MSRIQKRLDYNLYDDFQFLTGWVCASTDGASGATTPTPVAGHPGLIRLSCVADSGFGDALIANSTFGGAACLKPRDLERITMVFKPEVVDGGTDIIEVCEITGTQNVFYVSPPSYGRTTWAVVVKANNVQTTHILPTNLVTAPDGSTWYTVDCRFDYANLKVNVTINDVPCFETTVSASQFWDCDMRLMPMYIYTERGTTTDFKCLIDEFGAKLVDDTSDERPLTQVRDLDDRERFATNTIRTDNF